MHSLSGLNRLEIGAPCQVSLGGGGLILSPEAYGVVMDASKLSEFCGPPRFRVRGGVFGWAVGGDKMCELGKAVVKPEDKGVWGGES